MSAVYACTVLACSTDPLQVCTLVGCATGLLVHALGVGNVIAIEAEVSNSGPVFRWRCPLTAGCGDAQAVFEDFTPAFVRIRVITSRDTTTRAFQPVYKERFLNGREFGAACSERYHYGYPLELGASAHDPP